MLKIKNKFIIFIIIVILSIILFWLINSYLSKNKDKDSNVLLISWNALLNNKILELNKAEKLSIWDTVKTIWENALAILEWWDGSMTRIWWNSTVKIENLYVSSDKTTINIWFELLNWKSWSNVISFLWEDSYFKESFRDNSAAVRWTIFNLDLTNDYLYVIDHKVELTTSSWDTIILKEKEPFNLKNFSIIALEKYLTEFKDKTWESLNSKIDSEYLESLKLEISENINKLWKFNLSNIDSLTIEEKNDLYNEVLNEYQNLNFISPEDKELFELKIDLKQKLFELANEENKTILAKNLLYDLENIIDTKEFWNIDSVLNIISENKWSFSKLMFDNISIPSNLNDIININFNNLIDFFWNNTNKLNLNVINDNVNKIKDVDLGWIEDSVNNVIHENLDNWLDNVKNLFDK